MSPRERDVSAGPAPKMSVAALVEGLRFVRDTPILVWTMSLDFLATFFSSATALLPIFAKDILHAGARGYGVLYGADAIGALASGLVLSAMPNMQKQGKTVLWAVVVYGAATVLFGASRIYLLLGSHSPLRARPTGSAPFCVKRSARWSRPITCAGG